MDKHGIMQLRDSSAVPDSELLKQVLGNSYAAYEAFQAALPGIGVQPQWQWYTPYKAWLAKGQYHWTSKRGTKKEKTLYWLHVFDGYFSIAVWFKEKNHAALLSADLSEGTRQRIFDAQTMGKLATFPVVFDIRTAELPADVFSLIDCKKSLEL